VVLLVGAGLVSTLLTPKPGSIQVPAIVIEAPNNVCGLNTTPIYYFGDNWTTGSSIGFDLTVPNYNATACQVRGVASGTAGFTLSQVQVPLSIPSGGNASMNLTITAPGSPYSGNLTLIFR
jgi:hypothetical protein